jgi:hypothetical protein
MPIQDDPTNPSQMLALGRLEGKMDMVLSNQARASQELHTFGERLTKVEAELIALKTEKASTKSWTVGVYTVIMALFALILSALSTLRSWFQEGT